MAYVGPQKSYRRYWRIGTAIKVGLMLSVITAALKIITAMTKGYSFVEAADLGQPLITFATGWIGFIAAAPILLLCIVSVLNGFIWLFGKPGIRPNV